MFDRLEDIVKHYEELMFELNQSAPWQRIRKDSGS